MFVAAAFANEEALWLALCLQVGTYSCCHTPPVGHRNLAQGGSVCTRPCYPNKTQLNSFGCKCECTADVCAAGRIDLPGLCRCGLNPGMQREGRREQSLALLRAQTCHQA